MGNTKSTDSFGVRQLLRAAIPAYVMPLVTPGIPAYLLGKTALLKASYTTIGLSSLIATILGFFVLASLQKRQILIMHRFKMMLLLSVVMLSCAVVIVFTFGLQWALFDILPSVFIGTTIVSLTNPLKPV